MRHGNSIRGNPSRTGYPEFRSYLWGMETGVIHREEHSLSHSDPTYEAWKPRDIVWILSGVVRFRSYLWGMETSLPHTPPLPPHTHSDPTYEAWKLISGFVVIIRELDSDPTYEAWKPLSFVTLASAWAWFRSYLWGMETPPYTTNCLILRLFRSYLWGMETASSPHLAHSHKHIPILPMRHGN